MKINCILLFFLCSLFAQANNPDSTNRKWEIGIGYLYSTIDEFNDFFSREANYLLGFSAQANIYLKNKISVETGINYKYKRIENIGFGYSSNNMDDFNSIEIHKTNILELPIKFKFYALKKSKISFCFIGGITNSFYFRESVSLETGYGSDFTWSQNHKYYSLIVNLGIGGQYKINNNLGIILEPSVGYYAIGDMQEYGVIELKTGIAYHF